MLASMEKNTPVNDAQGQVNVSVCVAPGCHNSSINNVDVQFYRLTASKIGKVLESALAASSRSMAAVCSQHFTHEDYLEEKHLEGDVEKTQRTVKPEAIQKLFSSQHVRPQTMQLVENEAFLNDDSSENKTSAATALSKPREDKSLVLLTEKFMDILQSSPDGLLNINMAADKLQVAKRRLYDITNVLEGVQLLKKKSKLWVQWVGAYKTDQRLKNLVDEENKLDKFILSLKQQIRDQHEHRLNNKYAYLTYDDIQNIPIFQEQAVFFIKAPPETVIEVAHPEEAFQMHIVSVKGPVNVLGCTDSLDATQMKSGKNKFDGDYSSLPFRGLSKAATTSQDNGNQNNKIKKSQILLIVPPKAPNPPPSSLPLTINIMKKETTSVKIMPDKAKKENKTLPGHESEQLSSDVHMTDLS